MFLKRLKRMAEMIGLACFALLAIYGLLSIVQGGPAWAARSSAPASIMHASATSTVPGLLNYQGYLTDNSGAPLDGSYAIKFAIYDAPTDGNELWSETQLGLVINDGQLSALLGETETISPTLFATHKDTFIGVTVGSDPEMTPRQRIHSVPYAMYAEYAMYATYAMTATTEDDSNNTLATKGYVDSKWPEGNYCILRAGGSCPSGFSSGYMCLDTEDDGNADSAGGSIGDSQINAPLGCGGGSAAGRVRIQFCCKQ